MGAFEVKKEQLIKQLMEDTRQPVCLALSGGVDSGLLAALIGKCARENGTKAYGVTFDTVLHPAADLEAARKAAAAAGLIHKVIAINELDVEELQDNPKDRCYICKKNLFLRLQTFAGQHRCAVIYEGTNQDDLSQYRPGLKAVRELGVCSPFLTYEITKAEIRAWAAKLGIPAASRPSSPCMATRLPYGAKLELPVLRRIEAAEEALKELGFPVVRVRLHGEVVRLEVPKESLADAAAKSQEILRLLKALEFKYITLDLEGFRSGSMDL